MLPDPLVFQTKCRPKSGKKAGRGRHKRTPHPCREPVA